MSPTESFDLLTSGLSMGVTFFFAIAMYIYMALALMTIAQKTKTNNVWLAWIPIVHFFYMFVVGGKSAWYTLLLIIPIVNIIMTIWIWMKIAERRNKPSYWGIFMLIPLFNIVVPGYLAWSD